MTVSHTLYDRNFGTKKMPIKLMIDTFCIILFVIILIKRDCDIYALNTINKSLIKLLINKLIYNL